MGYGESLILLLLYHLYYLDKVSAVCSQSYQSYLDKGLRPDESPPHLPGQKVRYRCAYNRKVPGFQTVESTCVDNFHIGQLDLPECQCAQKSEFKCSAKSIQVMYNYPSPTSSSQTSSISITIPDLKTFAFWKLMISITHSDLDKRFFDVSASGIWGYDNKGYLVLKSSLASSSDGTLWINSTSNQIINGALTRKWQYPCVQDIDCSLTSADSVSLTTSIILSCVFLVLTILLIMSLRCCYLKAARNDKAKRREARQKMLDRTVRGGNGQVVETIPAVGQHCRKNHDEARERYIHDKERIDERLQFSYNARTPPSQNKPRTPPLQWNSYQHQANYYNQQHQQKHQYQQQLQQQLQQQIQQNQHHYDRYEDIQDIESNTSRHKHRQHRKVTSDPIAEVWKTANHHR